MGRVSIEKMRKKERTEFTRNLEIGAGPLRRALRRLFLKIARRHVRELKAHGVLTQPGMQPIAKALDPTDMDELARILGLYTSRRARASARRAGKLVGAEYFMDTQGVEQFLQTKNEFLAAFQSRTLTAMERQTQEVLVQIAREGGASTRSITRRIMHRVTGEGGALSPGRADRIARTEMAQIDNYVKDDAFAAVGVKEREWLTIMDDRARDDHMDMDGKRVPVGEPFELPDGTRMMHPGDSSLGAGPEQIINCRCTTVPVMGE